MSGNDLRKRNPLRNMQLTLGTAGAMASAAMMSTSFAFASEEINSALETVFDIGNGVAESLSSGLQKIVVPIGIAVFVYFLVRMLLASDPKDVQMYKKRLITTAIIVFVLLLSCFHLWHSLRQSQKEQSKRQKTGLSHSGHKAFCLS